ncbi:MAG: hypothetical protein WC875_03585 [Candidatus Absconditabacterales bacterium]|jgi:hypothetical protein
MKNLLILSLFITGIVILSSCGGVGHISKSQAKKQQAFQDSLVRADSLEFVRLDSLEKAKAEKIKLAKLKKMNDSLQLAQQLNWIKLVKKQDSIKLAKKQDSIKSQSVQPTNPNLDLPVALQERDYDSIPWLKLDTTIQRKVMKFVNANPINTSLSIICKNITSVVLVKDIPSRLGKPDDQFCVNYVALDGSAQMVLLRKDGTAVKNNANGTFNIDGPNGDDYRLPPYRNLKN